MWIVLHDVRLALVASLLFPLYLHRLQRMRMMMMAPSGEYDDDEDEDCSSSGDEEMTTS